jgi:hypothetical protein
MYITKTPKIFLPFHCKDLVRLGKDYDGGYLVNRHDIDKTDILISFGIGYDTSFEQDFIKLNDCKLQAFDNKATCSDKFFNKKRVLNYKNIGTKDSNTEVDIKNVLKKHKNIFLKCDIDGDEYQILDDIITYSDNICGIVIEMHHINDKLNEVINFISKVNLKLVHTHVNNYFYLKTEQSNIPDVLELTFTSCKNFTYDLNIELPNKLDMPNNPKDKQFKLVYS